MDKIKSLIENISYWNERGYRIEDDAVIEIPYSDNIDSYIKLEIPKKCNLNSIDVNSAIHIISNDNFYNYTIAFRYDGNDKIIEIKNGCGDLLVYNLQKNSCGFYNISTHNRTLKIDFVQFPNIIPANTDSILLPLVSAKIDVLSYHIDLIFGDDPEDYIVIDEIATHNTQKETRKHITRLCDWLQDNYELVYEILHSDKIILQVEDSEGYVDYNRNAYSINFDLNHDESDGKMVIEDLSYNRFFTLLMNGTWKVTLI